MILRLVNIALMCLLLCKLPQPAHVVEIMPPPLPSSGAVDAVLVAETQINRAMAERILTDPAALVAQPRLLKAIGFSAADRVTTIDELKDRLVFTVQRGRREVQLVVMIDDSDATFDCVQA